MALGSVGCTAVNSYDDPALVGDWKLTINEASEMSIDLDGEGDGTIAATVTLGDGSMRMGEIVYDIDWEQTSDDEFELDWACQSGPAGCSGASFIMDCESQNEGDEMECLARSGWDDPAFDWERD